MRLRVFASMLGLLLFAGALWSQTGTTSLRGTVTDKTGAAVPNANITLRNPARGVERSTTSGPQEAMSSFSSSQGRTK